MASTPEEEPMNLGEIITEYSALWTETDSAARLSRLRGTVTEDVEYCDPGAQVMGAEALNAVIGDYQEQFPGAALVQATALDHHHNVVRFGWTFIGPQGEELAAGYDICHLAPDNRIARFTVFFGEPPALA